MIIRFVVCKKMFCYVSPSAKKYIGNVHGFMDGTPCASGKVCTNGDCVQNANASLSTCIFPDQFIRQQNVKIELPMPVMTCQAFFDFVTIKQLAPRTFCTDKRIMERCCLTCQSKLTFDLTRIWSRFK